MFLRPVGRIQKPNQRDRHRKQSAQNERRTPSPSLDGSGKQNRCENSSCANPTQQQAAPDAAFLLRRPECDYLVGIGIARCLTGASKKSNDCKCPREIPPRTTE